MFFCMFKGRNQYAFSLIVFSFSSFFVLSGLSSVSNVKSTHEKPRKKSMMDQKVACNRKTILSYCTKQDDGSESISIIESRSILIPPPIPVNIERSPDESIRNDAGRFQSDSVVELDDGYIAR